MSNILFSFYGKCSFFLNHYLKLNTTLLGRVGIKMAPKIQVPCDFGREYINVPEHSNLKLKLKNKEDYLVNSVIMSYNSPEIKRLTSELHQTSLDMDDFDEDAVYCFVDALYSGELETIGTDIFADVYKMGRVFNVLVTGKMF